MEVERKYGEATTILFPLIDFGATDFEATPVSFASGDTQIMKDEGAPANTSNNPAHEGRGIYSLALTATEMQAARIVITVIDSATKTWEDQAIIIATYGNASAQHAFDRDVSSVSLDMSQTLPGSPTADTVGDALKQSTIEEAPKKNTALADVPVYMVSSTDHVTPATGLTLTVEISKDGGAFAAAAGSASEISSGLYQFDATAADMNADVVVLKFTATGADPRLIAFQTTE